MFGRVSIWMHTYTAYIFSFLPSYVCLIKLKLFCFKRTLSWVLVKQLCYKFHNLYFEDLTKDKLFTSCKMSQHPLRMIHTAIIIKGLSTETETKYLEHLFLPPSSEIISLEDIDCDCPFLVRSWLWTKYAKDNLNCFDVCISDQHDCHWSFSKKEKYKENEETCLKKSQYKRDS